MNIGNSLIFSGDYRFEDDSSNTEYSKTLLTVPDPIRIANTGMNDKNLLICGHGNKKSAVRPLQMFLTGGFARMSNNCGSCSNLAAKEYAMQKYGSDNNTYLPESAGKLAEIHDFKPQSSRKRILKQCQECKTYYLYRTDYEYLVGGSEDEEFLQRLNESEAEELLRQAGVRQ